MVLYCTVLHLTWAGLILSSHEATGATPVASLSLLFKSDIVLVVALSLAAVMSLAGLVSQLPWMVVLLMPQQSILLISAFGAMGAICGAQYADGVLRPQAFIAADQVGAVLAALAHAGAIIASTYDRVTR